MAALRLRRPQEGSARAGNQSLTTTTTAGRPSSDVPGRTVQLGGGTRGYTRGRDQSEEGQEDTPEAGTNRRRNKRIYPRRGPIGGGTRGYTRGGDLSEGPAEMGAVHTPRADCRTPRSEGHQSAKKGREDRMNSSTLQRFDAG
eukprot:1194736-Prorocentrum_minimum.AAC.1